MEEEIPVGINHKAQVFLLLKWYLRSFMQAGKFGGGGL